MTDWTGLTIHETVKALRDGRVTARALVDAYLGRIDATERDAGRLPDGRDGVGAGAGRRGGRALPARGPPAAPRGGAARDQGRALHARPPHDVRLAHPRGLRAPVRRDRRRAPGRRRRHRPRQDQLRRVRDGLLDGELRLPRDPQPLGPRPRAGRLVGRLRRRRGGRPGGRRPRHRHRRVGAAARRPLRRRRAQADLRSRLALRADRVRLVARPGGTARQGRPRRRAPARDHRRRGPAGLDRGRASRSATIRPP